VAGKALPNAADLDPVPHGDAPVSLCLLLSDSLSRSLASAVLTLLKSWPGLWGKGEHDGLGSIGPTTLETTGGDEIVCADTESVLGEQSEVFYRLKGARGTSEFLLSFTNCKEASGEEKECYSPVTKFPYTAVAPSRASN
jgi:hypothetical protein